MKSACFKKLLRQMINGRPKAEAINSAKRGKLLAEEYANTGRAILSDSRITRTRSDGSRYVNLMDAVNMLKADGRWEQIKKVRLSA